MENTIKSRQFILSRRKDWESNLRSGAQGAMAKGNRNPKPNHKQSGLETLKLGGSLSLSGPLLGEWVTVCLERWVAPMGPILGIECEDLASNG